MKATTSGFQRLGRAGLWLGAALLVSACGAAPAATSAPGTEGLPQPRISDATPPALQFSGLDVASAGAAAAANSASQHPPELALDGDPATYWQADGEAPQALEIDLGPAVDVAEIELVLFQAAAGKSVVRVYGRGPLAGDEYRLLHEFSGETADGQALSYSPAEPWEGISSLKIETLESPAPFGWRRATVRPAEDNPLSVPFVDSDGDGLSDLQDWCPASPGTYESNGC